MIQWFYFLLYFLIAATVAYFLTPLVRHLAIHYGVMDQPNARKFHERTVPSMGGLAIFGSFFITLFLVSLLHRFFAHKSFLALFSIFHLFLGVILLVLVGIADDRYRIHYLWKLAAQILASVVMIYFGYEISGVTNPFTGQTIWLGFWAKPLTIIWFLFIVNAVNFMDGVDGLAAGVSLIALITTFVVSLYLNHFEVAILTSLLAGSVVGFFRYNFYPASIFMGDTGSLFLGFLIAVLSLRGTQKSSTAVAITIPIVILGLPILDAMMAVIRRWSNEWANARSFKERLFSWRKVFYPDLRHIHHRLISLGLTKPQVVVLLYLVALGFGVAGFALAAARYQHIALLLFYMMIVFFIAFRKFPISDHSFASKLENSQENAPPFPTWEPKETLLLSKRKFSRILIWTCSILLPLFVFTGFLFVKTFWK